jgi:cellulose synthase operon protein C
VNKTENTLVKLLFSTALALTVSSAALAQTSAGSTAKKKKAGSVDSKTIGDLLKKIDNQSIQKGQNALPKFQAQQKAAAASVDLKAVKPPSSSKLYYDEGTDEAELEKVTDEGIEQLYTLSQQYRSSPHRGELWLRLAEAYVDKARLIEFRIMTKNDQAMAAFQAGKLKQKPKLDLSASKEYNKKAIQLYEWFLRDFPKDSKIDQALFFLGFNYFEIGDSKKGQEYYIRLTKEYPNSLYVSESNFALGEYNFENEHYKPALEYYSRVASEKASRLYSFALYKSAWCYYKLNQSLKGLTYLEQVIFEGRKSKGQKDKSIGGVSRIRLASEAIKDLIVFFAEAGDYRKARPYFESVIGEKSTNPNLAKLAYFYVDTGNRTAARFIFRDLIEQDPNSVKSFDYQYAIVKMYAASGDPAVFKKELYDWISQYGPDSDWQKTNTKEVDVVKKANELMESLLRNNILQAHQVAQNSRTKSAYTNAKSGYELYFQTFHQGTKIDEMHFFYAELLFDMNDYEKAAYHYSWVIENAPTSAYLEKSVLNALLSYEKRLPTDAQIRKMVGTGTEPIEFTPPIKAFEKAAFRFIEKSPKSENIVAVKYRLGALYYLFNQFDPAIKLLTEVVKKYPKTQYAKFAANHLLDIYNLKKDYVGLQNAANEMLTIPELAHSDIGNQIREIKLRTDFKVAKDLESKKDYEGSAKMYELFAHRNKGSDLSTPAMFNAAVNYERAGDVTRAIGVYTLVSLSTDKKAAAMKTKSSQFLPVLYEKTGQYAKAAQAFDAYAKSNPTDPLALEYLYNAAVIYDGMNSYSAALKNYDIYVTKHKGRDKFEVIFLMGKIYERQGQFDRAISEYNKYITSGTGNREGIVEATFTIAKLHERLERHKVSTEWYEKTVAVQRRLSRADHPVGTSFAAEAKFKLVYKTYEDLVAIRIPMNANAQGAAVKKKLALVNMLKDQLKAVVAYDDGPQIVAALTTQGQALHHLYSAIVNAPPPVGLKADEMKQYRDGVQKVAEPFKTQAIETYQTAIQRGRELEAYGPALILANKNLALLTGDSNQNLGLRALPSKLPDTLGL